MVGYCDLPLACGLPDEGEQCFGYWLTLWRTVCGDGTSWLVTTTMTFYGERSGNYNKRHAGTKEWEITCVYSPRYHNQELYTPDQMRCEGVNHIIRTEDTNMTLQMSSELTNILPQTIRHLTNERPTWCHLLFYFTYYALNMFRTLIYPSSGACDCVVELPHRSSCSVKMDVLAISVALHCVVVCFGVMCFVALL